MSAFTSDLPSLLAQQLGDDFVIERELTGGGMSRVFVAYDRRLERRVAIKVLRAELGAGVSGERFRREILTVAALQHPLIVPVLDTGDVQGLPYFTMPFVEGENLRVRLARGPLSVVETVRILRDVARALVVAHARGIAHRDIKPDNVLLAGDAAVVADFGVAKAFVDARLAKPRTDDAGVDAVVPGAVPDAVTTEGISLGTPAYMAPEQVAADPRAGSPMDLYAVGVLAYEMLTGTPPFVDPAPQRVMAAHIATLPEPITARRAELPPALAALIMQCLEKDPTRRPATAQALVDALEDPQVLSGSFTPIEDDGTGREALRVLTGGQPRSLSAPPTGSRGRWTTAAVIGTVATLAALLWRTVDRRPASPDAAVSTPVAAAPAADTTPSIAVLPFAYLSGDSTQAFAAQAIADAISDGLAREPGLRVISRTAATALQGRLALGDTAALPVRTLVEGVVEVEGETIRLTVRLVNARDGFTLFADRMEGTRGKLFAMEDDVATTMRELLRAHFQLPGAK